MANYGGKMKHLKNSWSIKTIATENYQ